MKTDCPGESLDLSLSFGKRTSKLPQTSLIGRSMFAMERQEAFYLFGFVRLPLNLPPSSAELAHEPNE